MSNRNSKARFLFGGLGLAVVLLSGCLGPVRRGGPRGLPPVTVPSTEGEMGPPTEGIEPVAGVIPSSGIVRGQRVGVWVPGPQTDPLASAQFLKERPGLRLTVVFPDHFFGEEERSRQAKTLFQTLVSSKQIEVVLTLPHRPVLPLIMDTQNAKLSVPPVSALPTPFAWPGDAVEQMGLARESFRRRWRQPPQGLVLPWGVALGPEFPLLAQVKLAWALLPSSGPVATWLEGLAVPVVSPADLPAEAGARHDWFEKNARSVLASSGTVGPFQSASLDDLASLDLLAGSTGTAGWALLSERVGLGPVPGERRAKPAPVDFSPWIGQPEENRAWDLLGVVRRAIDQHQNSGQADLRSLDLAKRAIHAAENGSYFDSFGSEKDGARNDDVTREFTASLAQVYPLLGQPVAPELRGGAAGSGPSMAVADESEGRFERDGDVLRWHDAMHDDRGPGDYFYPTGPQFPTGSWDLLAFSVTAGESEAVFSFNFADLSNPGRAPAGFSLPLVDLYIDINRSIGAGTQDLLPGRPGLVEAADAWEYAISVDGWTGRFIQARSRQDSRDSPALVVRKDDASTFSVRVPRRLLRGDPADWGFAVVVMGRSLAGSAPMAVAVEPGPDRFGGAVPNRSAPPYIDLLVPPGLTQRRILGVYKSGQDVTLPFVRAEQ